MISEDFCKGGCGNFASHKGWCKLKWKKGNRFAVNCPTVEKRRGRAISTFRTEEAKQGRNPMQNSEISKKNHSPARNRKAAESLRTLGELGLLPQQVESDELREIRRKRNQAALKQLWKEGKHPLQSKKNEELLSIRKKISNTLLSKAAKGELPIQNFSVEKKKEIAKKVSQKLREGIRDGRIKLSPGWKKVPYKNIVLRSYWEKSTAQFLDKHNIEWEYESLNIPYYDTTRDMIANTIPDFYLPELNIVIEVKSNREINSLRTKDKMDAIHQQGYKVFLFGYKQIKLIKGDSSAIIRVIKNEKS
ncbi:hypothetical protein HYU22_00770 [Candidatus Woesearchaeota archaeon]|nr:hypothetical protein [Candidatus Woesearchaeota archaeon]